MKGRDLSSETFWDDRLPLRQAEFDSLTLLVGVIQKLRNSENGMGGREVKQLCDARYVLVAGRTENNVTQWEGGICDFGGT